MVDFGELGKTHAHIGIGNGNFIEVPLLSVADYAEVTGVQKGLTELNERKETTDAQRMDAVIEARRKLAAIAAKVMPQELHENLGRLEFTRLLSLVMVLCTGDDKSEGDAPEKK